MDAAVPTISPDKKQTKVSVEKIIKKANLTKFIVLKFLEKLEPSINESKIYQDV